MGGKSRKSGGVSKKLIQQLKAKGCGTKKRESSNVVGFRLERLVVKSSDDDGKETT